MKVLHITTSLAVGGAEHILFEVATGQKRSGHEVYVISLRPEEYFVEKLNEQGIYVYNLFKSRSLTESRLTYFLWLILKWPIAYGRAKKFAPDVVQTWMYLANIYGGTIGYFVRKPVIWGIFAGSTNRKYYSWATYLLIRVSAAMSWIMPRLIVSCSAHARITHNQIGYAKNRIAFIPTGFSIKDSKSLGNINLLRETHGVNGPVRLGMLARISSEKDHILLVKAVASVIDSGYNVRLVLAGGVGLSKNDNCLLPIVAQYQLQDRVEFLGSVVDIEEFFSRVDLFLLISRSEGFPTVLGEAMARSLPCIASNVGDSRILLGDPEQLVEPSDIDQLVAAIRLFLEMSDKGRRAVGVRNRMRIQHLFPKEKMLRRYDMVYQHVRNSQ